MSPRTLTRVLLGVLAGALCGLVATSAVLVLRDRSGSDGGGRPAAPAVSAVPEASPAVGRSGRPVPVRAREVLRRWDAARAEAWTAADPRALARLYAPGSVAGARDVAMLRAWTARGARVTELTTQLLRIEVVAERGHRLEVLVTDRVARARVSGAGSATLPVDRASTRRIVLVRQGARWLVASVSPEPPGRS